MDCVVFRYTCVLKVNCEFSGCHQFLGGTVPKGRKVLSMMTHRSLALVMHYLSTVVSSDTVGMVGSTKSVSVPVCNSIILYATSCIMLSLGKHGEDGGPHPFHMAGGTTVAPHGSL